MKPAFYVLLGVVAVLALLMLEPFVTPVLVAVVLGYLLLPIYDSLGRVVKSANLRAIVMLVAVLFLLALPLLLVIARVSSQIPSALHQTDMAGAVSRMNDGLDRVLGMHLPLAENFSEYAARVEEAALHAAPRVMGAVGATALGLFVLLYTLFYIFHDGRDAWKHFVAIIPLDREMKSHLVANIQATMSGVLYGQFMTAVVQGALAGIGYLIFGISHVLFWTLITLMAAMVPIVGAVLIWAPLAISRLVAGDAVGGYGLLLYNGILVSSIDHVVKPRFIAGRSTLHPLAALFGVLGGIHLFGVVGFILGPILLGLLLAMLRAYREVREA